MGTSAAGSGALSDRKRITPVQACRIIEQNINKELAHLNVNPIFQTRPTSIPLISQKPTSRCVTSPFLKSEDDDSLKGHSHSAVSNASSTRTPSALLPPYPLTTAQEVGWQSQTMIPQLMASTWKESDAEKRFRSNAAESQSTQLTSWFHPRHKCDVVAYAEEYVSSCKKGPFQKPSVALAAATALTPKKKNT